AVTRLSSTSCLTLTFSTTPFEPTHAAPRSNVPRLKSRESQLHQ
ncbi:unnamed protein product, partial [Brassica oleracea var. botrytis]